MSNRTLVVTALVVAAAAGMARAAVEKASAETVSSAHASSAGAASSGDPVPNERMYAPPSGVEIAVTELGDRPPGLRRGGYAQGCCTPKIRRKTVSYVGDGALRLEAKIHSRYTHVLILYDREKKEILRETMTFLTDFVSIEISDLSCEDAPHAVRLWCPVHRSCLSNKKQASGECS